MVRRSMPPTKTQPAVGSSNRNSFLITVVLPAPLAPNNATFSPGSIVKLTRVNAGGASSVFFTSAGYVWETSANSILCGTVWSNTTASVESVIAGGIRSASIIDFTDGRFQLIRCSIAPIRQMLSLTRADHAYNGYSQPICHFPD